MTSYEPSDGEAHVNCFSGGFEQAFGCECVILCRLRHCCVSPRQCLALRVSISHRHVTSLGPLPACSEYTQFSTAVAEGGVSLIESIVDALSLCRPLEHLADSLWIVCPSSIYPLLTSSSQLSRVSASRIVSVQSALHDLTGCVTAFQQSSASEGLHSQSSLLIIDASSFCSWANDLQRFLTHSLLRNEISVAHTQASSWAGFSDQRAAFTLEDGSYNAKVVDIQQGSGYPQTSSQDILLCPLLCIPAGQRSTLFNATSQSSSLTQMMRMLLHAASVYSLPIAGCLWATGPDGVQLMQAYRTIEQAMKRSTMTKKPSCAGISKPSPQQLALESLSAILSSGADIDLRMISNPAAKDVREPPAVHLAAQKHQPKRQHPVYLTSNNAYGSKAPSLHELPLSWHGIRGDFTRTQATGKIVTTGLKTAISNHAVSDALHEFGL